MPPFNPTPLYKDQLEAEKRFLEKATSVSLKLSGVSSDEVAATFKKYFGTYSFDDPRIGRVLESERILGMDRIEFEQWMERNAESLMDAKDALAPGFQSSSGNRILPVIPND